MTTTDQISVRIDHATKASAEKIFSKLGLSATDAVRMFYRQVTAYRGLPFEVRIPNKKTIAAFRDADAGKLNKYTAQEFKERLKYLQK